MRNMERLDSSGVGRSKGFGFAQFACHEDALDVLRATNNNPKIFGPDRRPIVEFAIENNLILQRLEQRRKKNFQKVKANRESSKHEVNGNENKRKRERNETSKRKRVKKNENVNKNSVDISGQLEHSNASKVRSFRNRQGRRKENTMKGLPESGETSAENKRNNLKNKVGMEIKSDSSAKAKIGKVDLEEQRFNQIVEKYKTKLFGKNSKQLKASRWFDT